MIKWVNVVPNSGFSVEKSADVLWFIHLSIFSSTHWVFTFSLCPISLSSRIIDNREKGNGNKGMN